VIWAVLAAGLLLAILGATAGSALVATSRTELARFATAQLRGGRSEGFGLGQLERLLVAAASATSLGVLLLGAALVALLASVTTGRLPVIALLLLVGVPVVLVGGYLVPRWLAWRRPEGALRWTLPLLRPWAGALGLLLPSDGPGEESRFRAILREGSALDPEASGELELVGGVLSFAERPVREVMTPRTDIVAIADDAPLDEIRLAFAHSGYSRLPVYRGSLDEIVGMLHAFDLFKLKAGAPLPVRAVAVAPASRPCGQLLVDMQRERRLMAVVLDEYGGTSGVVTLDDLLATIVGEIADDDEPTPPAGTGPGLLEADGSISRSQVEQHFDVLLPPGRSASVGGLLADLAGRIPAAGERFIVAGLEVDVVQASPARVERLLIRLAAPPPVRLGPA
jgi:CBS domain containing-hemolysin-like protein